MITALLAYFIFKPTLLKKDKVLTYYSLFLRKLAKSGVATSQSDGATTIADKSQKQLPDKKLEIIQITDLYQRIRYREDKNLTEKFIKQVKEF